MQRFDALGADSFDREYGQKAPPPQFRYPEQGVESASDNDSADDGGRQRRGGDAGGPPPENGPHAAGGSTSVNTKLLEALSFYTLADLCETREIWSRAPNAARAIALRRVQSGDDVSEAFTISAASGNAEALVWLLRYGADVNFRQASTRTGAASGITICAATPLMIASALPSETDAVRTVDTLLSLGADVDAVDTFTMETALHSAQYVSIVSRLLDAGARPDVVNEQGLTPIAMAWARVKHGALQEFKRRFNYYTHRSLRAAIELHDFKVARDFLADGHRVDLRDWATRQSVSLFLAHAVMEGRRDIVERFLQMDVIQNGPDYARSGAGMVNCRVWIESAQAYLPLLHIAAYAGMEGSFTDVSPPNPDPEDPIAGLSGGGAYGRSVSPPARSRSRLARTGGRSRFDNDNRGDDDDDDLDGSRVGRGRGGGAGGGIGGRDRPLRAVSPLVPRGRDRPLSYDGRERDRPGDISGSSGYYGRRLDYDDDNNTNAADHTAASSSSGLYGDHISRHNDGDGNGSSSADEVAFGASANPRALRSQLASAAGGDDRIAGRRFSSPHTGTGASGGVGSHRRSRFDSDGDGDDGDGDGGKASRGRGRQAERTGDGMRSPSDLRRSSYTGRYATPLHGSVRRGLLSTLDTVEDENGAGDGGGGGFSAMDDEEDEAAIARRKYRRLVKALLSHGARWDAVIEWKLPAVSRRKRRSAMMRRYGDDSDDDDEGGGFGRRSGSGSGGPAAGLRQLIGTLKNATALHVAAYFGRTGFVQEWIAAGGPLELQAGGSVATPLQVAELEDRPGIVQLMRTAGADTHPRGSDFLLSEDLRQAGGNPRELASTRRLVTSRLKRILADGLAAARSRSAKDFDFSPVLDALFALNGDALLDALLRGQTFNPQKDDDIRMACGALLGQAILALRVDVLTALLQLDRAHNGVRGARSGGGIINARLAFSRPDLPKGAPPMIVLTTPLHLLAEMSHNKREEGMKAGARARHEAMVSELLRFRPNPRALAEPARTRQPYSMCSSLTALHLFAAHDDVAAIRMWHEAGVPVDLETSDAGTPLHLAIRCGNVAAARALILAGADVSALCCLPLPSPPVHRLVEYVQYVDAQCDKIMTSAASGEGSAASSSGGGDGGGGTGTELVLYSDDAAATCRHLRSIGARRVTILTRLLKRSGANLSSRSHGGRTVVGSILSSALLRCAAFMQLQVMTYLMPQLLEGRRDAWYLDTSIPLFQARLSGALATAAASQVNAEIRLASSQAASGGVVKGHDPDVRGYDDVSTVLGGAAAVGGGGGASTILDADSVTLVSGTDGRSSAASPIRGRAAAAKAISVLDAADGLTVAKEGEEAEGGGGKGGEQHQQQRHNDGASATGSAEDAGSAAGGDEGSKAPSVPMTFAHRTDMLLQPTASGDGNQSASSPDRHGVPGSGHGHNPSSPYAIAAAVGLGGYNGDGDGQRDERDLVCELMPEGWQADEASEGTGPQLAFVLAIEVLNSIGGSADLWADSLQSCLVTADGDPWGLPMPAPTRVDLQGLV